MINFRATPGSRLHTTVDAAARADEVIECSKSGITRRCGKVPLSDANFVPGGRAARFAIVT